MNRNVLRILIALIVFTLTVTGCVAPITGPATENPESAEYAEFLADNFGVSFEEPVTQDAFLAALRAAIPTAESVELPAEVDMDEFSTLEAVLTGRPSGQPG